MDFLRTLLLFLVLCGGLGFVFRDDLSKLAGLPSTSSAGPANIDSPALKSVYERLKIEPLSPQLAAQPSVAGALKDLTISFCDRTAIYRLMKGLVAKGERKPAAVALISFADASKHGW